MSEDATSGAMVVTASSASVVRNSLGVLPTAWNNFGIGLVANDGTEGDGISLPKVMAKMANKQIICKKLLLLNEA